MRQAYRAILGLYPAEHRAIFAEEMLQTFEQAALDWRNQGFPAFICFAAWELTGLLSGVFMEWISKWTDQDGYMNSPCLSQGSDTPTEVIELEKRLKLLIGRMEFAIAHHDFPRARLYSDEERILRAQLHQIVSEYKLNDSPAPAPDPAKSNGCS